MIPEKTGWPQPGPHPDFLTANPRLAAHSGAVGDGERSGEQADGAAVPELRVGDAERRAAMLALDAHMEAGRLSVDEYGDRSAAAAGAVHRADLAVLFVDLPAPHPPLPRRPGDAPLAIPAPAALAPVDHPRPVPHPGAGLAFGLMILLVVALPVIAGAVATGGVPVGGFLLFPLLFLVLGGVGRHRGRRHGGPGERD